MNQKLAGGWARVSLRTKLTALSVAIIGLLLAISSVGTISLLATYMQRNTDTILLASAEALSDELPQEIQTRISTGQLTLPDLPSDYYIAYLKPDGSIITGFFSGSNPNRKFPNLSNFTLPEVIRVAGMPFEIDELGIPTRGIDDSRGWRILAVPTTASPGSLVIALPVANNHGLIAQYRTIGAGFGILLLILSALAIWFTITSALRPLKEVERTAQAVAAGEIGSRLVERSSKTEVGRINKALNSMLDSIQGALDSRGKALDQMRRFVSDASHELRTPLASVRGYAELYRMGALQSPEEIGQAMERIEKEAIRMGALVEDLLELARMDETRPLEIGKFDLLGIAQDAALDARAFDPERTITVEGDSVEIFAAENKIRQVVTNLMGNALRFTESGTPLELVVTEDKDKSEATISIVDHGDGIPKQIREKIFERFYRADNSRARETGGSGLGLAIVASIVKAHQGRIDVTATKGGGATFSVTLPVVHTPLEA